MRRRFRETLHSVLFTSVAASAVAACSSGVDTDGLAAVPCTQEPLAGVTPTTPAAYVELRTNGSGRARGVRCEGATDPTKCEADYATAVAGSQGGGTLFGSTFPEREFQTVIVTDVNGVHVYRTKEELLAWIAPIDSNGDAVAAVEIAGYRIECGDVEKSGVGKVDGEYRVAAERTTKFCEPIETTQYLLRVDPTGTTSVIEEDVIDSTNACIGRRPEGLVMERSAADSKVGRWLAEVAYLEAASVASFERMAAELERFGAPASLVARARRASADEVRHAAAMERLAACYGAEVPAQRPLAFGERSLESFTEENAVEGCILETFGALIGLAQAEHAANPEIRRTMKRIANDETRHGALAWDVHAWAMARLPVAARARIEAAKADAVASLAERDSELDPFTARALGVPSRALLRTLASRFAASLDQLAA